VVVAGYALGVAVSRRLPAASGGIDGVGGVDGEAWTALRHARLNGDLRGTTTER
jgi:hypothetical protein